tara:strand:- start:349 stop:690 length:342 start_codon:yes stop_codon:yes gene_type:complete
MTNYTVIAPSGTVIDRNLTPLEAMSTILEHDGYDWKITVDEDKYQCLWHSDGSAYSTRGARNFVKTVAMSPLAGPAGELEIAHHVIHADWPNLPEAMTDSDYDEMQSQIAADA